MEKEALLLEVTKAPTDVEMKQYLLFLSTFNFSASLIGASEWRRVKMASGPV